MMRYDHDHCFTMKRYDHDHCFTMRRYDHDHCFTMRRYDHEHCFTMRHGHYQWVKMKLASLTLNSCDSLMRMVVLVSSPRRGLPISAIRSSSELTTAPESTSSPFPGDHANMQGVEEAGRRGTESIKEHCINML